MSEPGLYVVAFNKHFLAVRVDASGFSVNFTHKRHKWLPATFSSNLKAHEAVSMDFRECPFLPCVIAGSFEDLCLHRRDLDRSGKAEGIFRLEDSLPTLLSCLVICERVLSTGLDSQRTMSQGTHPRPRNSTYRGLVWSNEAA